MIKIRRKSILYGIAILATAAVTVINVNLNSQPQTNRSSVKFKNIDALSSETDWSKLKLEKVRCTCTIGGKTNTGETLRCTDKGKLENCSTTQQGSNGCYKIGLTGMSLLCQGEDASFAK
ncbi:MAG: hypothetical protein LBG92_02340 [Prevotellaceae bacterium]|jgi:hypothetical protein|nr:hypothetical protein [Prevotellaceae bacterium]